MSNPLFQQMNVPTDPTNGILQRFQQFRQAFTGDPRQQVQQLLNSGRVSQTQYNQAVQLANQLSRFISGK